MLPKDNNTKENRIPFELYSFICNFANKSNGDE